MISQVVLLSALVASTQARFGQEQVPIPAISALSNFGSPGVAATLAGGDISTLLAAANPCAKLQAADAIVAQLGTDPQVISAAKGLVAAEQNFNPFAVSVPNICSETSLPATAELRGIVPLIDPAVSGSDTENANSNQSLTTPFTSDGLSVAQIMVNAGFSNFTTTALDGTKGTANAGVTSNSSAADAAASSAAVSSAAAVSTAVAVAASSVNCNAVPTTLATVIAASSAAPVASSAVSSAVAAASTGAATATTNSTTGVQQSTIAGLDFGLCVPTMKFEAGLDGRSDTEFTFQAIDPLVNKGQQEALNPNIITNRICDQLTNVCEANDAAKTACAAAKTQISSLGTKDSSTADAWNTALGFAGTNLNPDNAPQAGLIGHD